MTFMWCFNDMFPYMLKAEFAALVSLKVPSGCFKPNCKVGMCGSKIFEVLAAVARLDQISAELISLTGVWSGMECVTPAYASFHG